MSATPPTNSAPLSFEQAMRRLEEIVEAMQTGRIGIEDSLMCYEEAMALAAHCRRILDEAELKVQKVQLDAGGDVKLTPFAASANAGPGSPVG